MGRGDASSEAIGTRTDGDGTVGEARAPDAVRQALAAERIEAATRTIRELKATKSELQYDLSVALDSLAEERKRGAVAEEQHRAQVAEERRSAAVAAERHRASIGERDADSVREIAGLRLQVACVEQDNAALRDEVRRLSGVPALLEKRRVQLADLRQRLSLASHDRKALRRELKRRAGLLARLRSDRRAAEESVSALQRRVRELERENWALQVEAGANGIMRKQNVELACLVDDLGEGFHAVRASRRWRLGGALLAVPRLLLFRAGAPTVPDTLLRLVAEHRRRRTMAIGPPPTGDRGARHVTPDDEDDGPRG